MCACTRSVFTQAALLAVLPGMAHALIPLRSYAPHTLPSSYANVAGRRKRVLIYVPRMQVEKVEEVHVSLHEEDRKRAEAKRLQEVAMAAKGDGQGGSKKKAKVPKTRADALLVERGLAAHPNEALALILKKAVIADEGKIIVDKASTMLPQVLMIYRYFLSILLDYDLIVDKASTLFCPRLASPSPRARARTHT